MDFRMDGNLFAYATGYDWNRGISGFKHEKLSIAYRECAEEAKPKAAKN